MFLSILKKVSRYWKSIGLSVFFSFLFLKITYWVIYLIPSIENIFLSALISCVLIGFFVFYLTKQKNLLDHLYAGIFSFAVCFSITTIVMNILTEPFFDWNSARLVWTFSIKHGYKVFCGLFQGPILARMYGPLMPFSYWPCTWMKTPISAIWMGSFLSVLFIFVPTSIFFIVESRKQARFKEAFFCYFLFFCLLAFNAIPLTRSMFMIHADAPSIGFAILACLMLYLDRLSPKSHHKLLSAFLVVCSVWTKQIAAPLLIALPLYLWITQGRKVALIYFAQILLISFCSLAFFSHVFGFQYMFQEMFLIPSRHPSRYAFGWTRGFLLVSWFWIKSIFPYALCVILSNFKHIKGLLKQKIRLRNFLKQNYWFLFIWVGIFMAPTAILGMLKMGGDFNNLSFSLYFFVLAAAMSITRLFLNLRQRLSKNNLKIVKVLFCVLVFCLMAFRSAHLYEMTDKALMVGNCPQQIAYELALEYPERIYFPDSVLSMYFADKEIYNSLDGIYDRKNANIPISPEHFKKYLPKNLEKIAMLKIYPYRHMYVLEHLPGFRSRKEVGDMIFWIVYEKQ